VAYGATSYSGKTSQGLNVSFKVGQVTINHHKVSAVRNLHVKINDKCPDGHTLVVTSSYPDMPIANGKYGGGFVPANAFKGEHSTIAGTVSGKRVKGTLKDWSHSARENRICFGKASWNLKHK
jgi:hypothetical protein